MIKNTRVSTSNALHNIDIKSSKASSSKLAQINFEEEIYQELDQLESHQEISLSI
jgi:type IV secretory pathway component VirB8